MSVSNRCASDDSPAKKWEVQADFGWEPWCPAAAFNGEVGEEVFFTRGSFSYKATFDSPTSGCQLNLGTGKERQLRYRGGRASVVSDWEVEVHNGLWHPFAPGVPFRGEPGEEVFFTSNSFSYKVVFHTPRNATQINLATRTQRQLRRLEGGSGACSDAGNAAADEVRTWSCVKVRAWLEEEGFSCISQRAEEEALDGESLLELTEEDLKELGLEKMGPRRKLSKRITELRDNRTGVAAVAQTVAGCSPHDSSESRAPEAIQRKDMMWEVPEKKVRAHHCMGCRESLKPDHTGIVCRNDHHVCANDCAQNFINHVLSEGPAGVPVMCMNCHCDVVVNTFERNCTPAQLAIFEETCVLVGGAPSMEESWYQCPLCPMKVIIFVSPGDIIFHCPGCMARSCMICRQRCARRREQEWHLLHCPNVGELRNELTEIIGHGGQRACPNCGESGRKDDACTHITCPRCRTRWCYVCGEDRQHADGGEANHNVGWETCGSRCPMYLEMVHNMRADWPDLPRAALDHFHQRRILWELRQKVEDVGRIAVEHVLEMYPSTLATFTLDQIEAASLPRDW